jgi:anti-anti-sigma regulatory factor
VSVADSCERLAFRGALGADRYPEFRTAFECASPERALLLDLRGASSVDATFLAELLLFWRHRRPLRVAVIVQPRGELERLFGLPPMKGKIAVFTNEAAALAALEREPSATEPENGELAAGT